MVKQSSRREPSRRCAKAQMALESKPPDKNAPRGASETICRPMAASNRWMSSADAPATVNGMGSWAEGSS